MLTIIITAVIGCAFGLFLAGLLGAAHQGDHQQDIWQAYQDGFAEGRRRAFQWKDAEEPQKCRTDFIAGEG